MGPQFSAAQGAAPAGTGTAQAVPIRGLGLWSPPPRIQRMSGSITGMGLQDIPRTTAGMRPPKPWGQGLREPWEPKLCLTKLQGQGQHPSRSGGQRMAPKRIRLKP